MTLCKNVSVCIILIYLLIVSTSVFAQVKTGKFTSPKISVEGQLNRAPSTAFDVPQVDSFSISGSGFNISTQMSVKFEWWEAKKQQWAIISGIGYGVAQARTTYQVHAGYTSDGIEIPKTNHEADLGYHIIANSGIALKHPCKNFHLQHTFMAGLIIPFNESTVSGVFERSVDRPTIPIPLIIETKYNRIYRRNKVIFGIEYQPEWILKPRRKNSAIFYAIGAVLNYSWGEIARGKVIADNGRTRYEGWATQGFSKIGLSFRIGWDSQIAKNRNEN